MDKRKQLSKLLGYLLQLYLPFNSARSHTRTMTP